MKRPRRRLRLCWRAALILVWLSMLLILQQREIQAIRMAPVNLNEGDFEREANEPTSSSPGSDPPERSSSSGSNINEAAADEHVRGLNEPEISSQQRDSQPEEKNKEENSSLDSTTIGEKEMAATMPKTETIDVYSMETEGEGGEEEDPSSSAIPVTKGTEEDENPSNSDTQQQHEQQPQVTVDTSTQSPEEELRSNEDALANDPDVGSQQQQQQQQQQETVEENSAQSQSGEENPDTMPLHDVENDVNESQQQQQERASVETAQNQSRTTETSDTINLDDVDNTVDEPKQQVEAARVETEQHQSEAESVPGIQEEMEGVESLSRLDDSTQGGTIGAESSADPIDEKSSPEEDTTNDQKHNKQVEDGDSYPPVSCGVWGSLRHRSHPTPDLKVLYLLFEDIELGPRPQEEIPSPAGTASEILENAHRNVDDGTPANETLPTNRTRKEVNPNSDFVEGLDDIGKLFEDVDPPDELDVGASGTSIQEVLMGRGSKIVIKRVKMGARFVSKWAVVAKDKIMYQLTNENSKLRNIDIDNERIKGAATSLWTSSKSLFHKAQKRLDKLFDGGDIISFFSGGDQDDDDDLGSTMDMDVKELLRRKHGGSKAGSTTKQQAGPVQ